jgi:hypothetical protein
LNSLSATTTRFPKWVVVTEISHSAFALRPKAADNTGVTSERAALMSQA